MLWRPLHRKPQQAPFPSGRDAPREPIGRLCEKMSSCTHEARLKAAQTERLFIAVQPKRFLLLTLIFRDGYTSEEPRARMEIR